MTEDFALTGACCGFWALELLTLCGQKEKTFMEEVRCDSLQVWVRIKGKEQHLLQVS